MKIVLQLSIQGGLVDTKWISTRILSGSAYIIPSIMHVSFPPLPRVALQMAGMLIRVLPGACSWRLESTTTPPNAYSK